MHVKLKNYINTLIIFFSEDETKLKDFWYHELFSIICLL